MIRRAAWCIVLVAGITGCQSDKKIELGSLNEPGTPNEFLAQLESRLNAYMRDGRVSGTVKDQQIIQGLRIGVDKEHFFVRNTSNFYIDQLSFACDVDRKQFVFFIWNVASEEVSGKFKIEWLVPQTSYRAFPNPKEPLILIHNDSSNNESLHFNQVQWLIRTYKPHDCVPLDVASDAQEEDPRIPIVE